MSNYRIFAGLGGGFGGANEVDVLENTSRAEAEDYAYELALQEYEMYDGLHGLRTVDDIIDKEGVDEREAYEIYNEERESWLEYYVEEIV